MWIEGGDRTVQNGGEAIFFARAEDPDGGPLSFTWWIDGEVIADAAGPSLRVTRSPAEQTDYLIRVRASDRSSSRSSDAKLTVTDPAVEPRFGEAQIGGPFHFTVGPCALYGYPVSFADLDADGDLDMIGSQSDYWFYELHFEYAVNRAEDDDSEPRIEGDRHNPFALEGTVYIAAADATSYTTTPVFADFDDDGDLDAIAYNELSGDSLFAYIENRGTAGDPRFEYPRRGWFGLGTPPYRGYAIAAADIDGDGDIDLLGGGLSRATYEPVLVFTENIGTATGPEFAAPVEDPFDLQIAAQVPGGYSTYFVFPELADLDGDGDSDLLLGLYTVPYGGSRGRDGRSLLRYFENIGTPTEPNFTASPGDFFGLSAPPYTIFRPRLADIDNDGDLDLVAGLLPTIDPDRERGFWDSPPRDFDVVYAENVDIDTKEEE